MRSIEDLIPTLVKVTAQDKLSWKRTDTHHFTAELPSNYAVEVWQWTDEDSGISGISAELSRGNNMLDRTQADEFSSSHSSLQRLLDVARRSATNIDQVIDDIEGMLSGRKKS